MTRKPVHQAAESHSDDTALERIVFFSDAVFAIAITLLALDIRIPELSGDLAVELPKALIDAFPQFISFIIGFLVIALYWTAHHRVFRLVRRYDGGLIWLNLILLMTIAFMPIPTSLIGRYGDQPIAAIIYALVVMAASLAQLSLWWHISRHHRLIDPEVSPRLIRYYFLRSLVLLFVFALSIPIALIFGSYVAELSWILLWVLSLLLRRRFDDVQPQVYGTA
ncbi:MAG: TMEM175 family protein [Anaerolineae bacterium]